MKDPFALHIEMHEDGSKCRLRIEDKQEDRSLFIDLDASSVDKAIQMLGNVRASMSTPIAAEPPEGAIPAAIDPKWRMPADAVPQGIPLLLQHPAFGWLAWVFPKPEAETIAATMAKINAETPASSTIN